MQKAFCSWTLESVDYASMTLRPAAFPANTHLAGPFALAKGLTQAPSHPTPGGEIVIVLCWHLLWERQCGEGWLCFGILVWCGAYSVPYQHTNVHKHYDSTTE